MKKLLFIILLATIGITSCKKTDKEAQRDAELKAMIAGDNWVMKTECDSRYWSYNFNDTTIKSYPIYHYFVLNENECKITDNAIYYVWDPNGGSPEPVNKEYIVAYIDNISSDYIETRSINYYQCSNGKPYANSKMTSGYTKLLFKRK